MSTNADAMIRAGVEAYRAGDKAKARQMLEKAIELDQYSEMAWLWLSAVVESKEEQKTCLENVLVINPQNERARQGLKSLGIDPDSVLSAAAAPAADSYQVPSSSASVASSAAEPSTEEYDDWVGNLNIKSSANQLQSDDVFGADDFSADAGFDFGGDVFGEDPYDDSTEYADEGEVSYESDATYNIEYGTEDDIFGDEQGYGEQVSDMDDLYADINTLEEFSDVLDEDIHDYDRGEFAGDPFAEPEEEPEGPSISELFAQIPPGIEATRLPGTVEDTPTGTYVVLGVLGVLNVLSLGFLLLQFAG